MQTRLFTENKLVVATHNQGKLREIRALLVDHGITMFSTGELSLDEPEETEIPNAVRFWGAGCIAREPS